MNDFIMIGAVGCYFILLDICLSFCVDRMVSFFYYFNALHQSRTHTILANINGRFLIKLQLIVFCFLFFFFSCFAICSISSTLSNWIRFHFCRIGRMLHVFRRWLQKPFNKLIIKTHKSAQLLRHVRVHTNLGRRSSATHSLTDWLTDWCLSLSHHPFIVIIVMTVRYICEFTCAAVFDVFLYWQDGAILLGCLEERISWAYWTRKIAFATSTYAYIIQLPSSHCSNMRIYAIGTATSVSFFQRLSFLFDDCIRNKFTIVREYKFQFLCIFEPATRRQREQRANSTRYASQTHSITQPRTRTWMAEQKIALYVDVCMCFKSRRHRIFQIERLLLHHSFFAHSLSLYSLLYSTASSVLYYAFGALSSFSHSTPLISFDISYFRFFFSLRRFAFSTWRSLAFEYRQLFLGEGEMEFYLIFYFFSLLFAAGTSNAVRRVGNREIVCLARK